MSSRHQKEKRLRPQRDPYKRDHFNQSKYLQLGRSFESIPADDDDTEDSEDSTDYDDVK